MGADYLALLRELTAEQVERLTEGLQRVPLRDLHPALRARFYVAPGLVLPVSASVRDGSFSVWAGATHRSGLAPLADTGVEWSRFDG